MHAEHAQSNNASSAPTNAVVRPRETRDDNPGAVQSVHEEGFRYMVLFPLRKQRYIRNENIERTVQHSNSVISTPVGNIRQ